jgi:hypothetical protein
MVMLEAEFAHAVVAAGDHAWTPATERPEFAGDGYMIAEPDLGVTIEAPDVGTATELRFDVAFATPGTYIVWIRGWSAGGGGDSVHIGLDDEGATFAANVYGFGPDGWSWSHLRAGGGIATLEVTTAGVHTVHVWMREDGFAFDRLILTVDVGYAPGGKGPRPSPRVNEAVLDGRGGMISSTDQTDGHTALASEPAKLPSPAVVGDGTGGVT